MQYDVVTVTLDTLTRLVVGQALVMAVWYIGAWIFVGLPLLVIWLVRRR